jgi:excinuclease ABC subunit A
MRTTRLRGARTHNLRGIDLDLAPGTLVAIAGPSGAGKSSLAFGTLYAEGQRRYVESFSAYARQFLERLARPPVDRLEPVAAGIAVDRQAPVRTSRSTVGTMTEVADYAKSLWARAAELHCRACGEVVRRDEPEAIVDVLLGAHRGAKVMITYPVPFAGAEGFLGAREALAGAGYRRVLVDGAIRDLDQVRPSDVIAAGDRDDSARKKVASKKTAAKTASKTKRAKKTAPEERATSWLSVLADRAVIREEDRGRLVEAIETAMARGGGAASAVIEDVGVLRYSRALHCAACDLGYRDATPGIFSFNSAVGACDACRGFGRVIGIDWEKVFPDPARTLGNGGISCWRGKSTAWERRALGKHAAAIGLPLETGIGALTVEQRHWLIEGDALGWPKGWFGLRKWFEWLQERAYKMHVRVLLSRYRSYEDCLSCGGHRLKPEALLWRIDGRSIGEFGQMPVREATAFLDRVARRLEAQGRDDAATMLLLRECRERLRTLEDVGLGYLALDRASRTLSGGEAQRVALTSALGSSLCGSMFVLDEPTVGLHPSDVARLTGVIDRLKRDDNLVLVVEHDPDVLRSADRVIELGPGAGEHGGRVVFDGTPRELAAAETATGRALREGAISGRARRCSPSSLVLRGARGHNLDGVDLRIPIGALTVVTGPSGSGKSSLVLETLVPAAERALSIPGAAIPLVHRSLEGAAVLSGVVHVDQAPLGRTSRGNAATYLGAWDAIRKRFAREPLSKERGYADGYFSFNVEGGRCETCRGDGAETVEMQFLADVTFSCPDCGGRRFVGPVLDVVHRGMTVADVLEMTANEAVARFSGDRLVLEHLAPMIDVGLGYLRLGQSLNTLSGGEAQRLKLALALAETPPGALVVLDEPTAGLHAEDVAPLMEVLGRFVERGDTVVVVEHDMRIAALADRVIDLGPGAGSEGGRIVAEGTPEEVARVAASRTAPYLARALGIESDAGAAELGREARPAPDLEIEREPVIEVVRAHEHNLRDVSVRIPREKLVAVTGPSGSGKSTLAFDVIFAEGQRRYLETLSPYARQYLPQLPRPAVDRVAGVPPTVSVEQRITRGGANSTVATVTEVAHYLRLLYARAGLLHCVDCKVPIAARAPALLADDVLARFGARAEIAVLAPVVRGRKGHHRELLGQMREKGFVEARIDGAMRKLEPGLSLARFVEHVVEVVVARVRGDRAALETALRTAADMGEGSLRVVSGGADLLLSTKRACPSCGKGYPELDPRFFSFNTKQGQCASCEGHGAHTRTVGRGKTVREVREVCEACGGSRLSSLARAVTVDDRDITAVLGKSVEAARRELASMSLAGREAEIGGPCLSECEARLRFLEEVGLGYLGLDRPADTLSGGETQRVRLAAQLGSGLTGLLYVLDEPTIGLHPRDTGKLIGALRSLVDKGNSVLVVEHDSDVIRASDHVVDVGPGGGKRGGTIIAEGSPDVLARTAGSVTGAALARPASIPAQRRSVAGVPRLELGGARGHNLRGIDVSIPLGRLAVVTGVSGSGKSTLVRRVLLPAVREALGLVNDEPGLPFASLRGAQHLMRATMVDQSPIGRTPRSVPATYVGVWDEIRRLLAATPEARARGWDPSRFSFNVAHGGRCPTCDGNGALTVEMAFLPDVFLPCDGCSGMRFTRETLDARIHDRSAGDLLKMEIEEAASVLSALPKVARPLALLTELGLGYLELGQPSNTLSGGEAQRLKLVAELGTTAQGRTLYVLDEPTTGLHRDDVVKLTGVLTKFVERGDSVVVIEHHPDVILAADWVIDLGPEGGEGGGQLVAQGTPEEIAACERSHTGRALRDELARSARSEPRVATKKKGTRAREIREPAP